MSARDGLGRIIQGLEARATRPLLPDLARLAMEDPGPAGDAAAFLVSLAGPRHRGFAGAEDRLGGTMALRAFFGNARTLIEGELDRVANADARFRAALDHAATHLEAAEDGYEVVWPVTFPPGAGIRTRWPAAVAELRRRRTVRLIALNPDPITDPTVQVLFTANVLVGPAAGAVPGPGAAPPLRFDHPIPLDADIEASEVAHGLAGLEAAVAFECGAGPGPKAKILLSVTGTMPDLERPGLAHVAAVVSRFGPYPHLDVYGFGETTAQRLVGEVLLPALGMTGGDGAPLREVFGTEGAYGRHYSFLKAIAAVWSVCLDPEVTATFKIDLDQVFPQPEMMRDTATTLFGHLRTARWGGIGIDDAGHRVDLSMIAGSLVEPEDVAGSVFSPDVLPVEPGEHLDDVVFFSRLPQALSTEAEMMAQHRDDGPDGVTGAFQRIHVTGGVNGVLVAALRRWRPFVPSFLGRAEDQAYVLSTMGDRRCRLGYVHEPGLVMRHDKRSLLPGVIAVNRGQKRIGDLVRILQYSRYVETMADPRAVRSLIDPFTGCFVSAIPLTVTLLRFGLGLVETGGTPADAFDAMRRLEAEIDRRPGYVSAIARERRGWDMFYDALDAIEAGVASSATAAVELAGRGAEILRSARIRT